MARHLFEGVVGFADLEARISALPTERDRGDAFEVFAEAYLATQKLVGAEQVWPADQVPVAVLQSHALPAKDMGTDGVYKTWAGQKCSWLLVLPVMLVVLVFRSVLHQSLILLGR